MAELSVRISFTFVSDRREDSTPPTRSRRVRTRLRRFDLRLLCRGGRSQLRLSRALLRCLLSLLFLERTLFQELFTYDGTLAVTAQLLEPLSMANSRAVLPARPASRFFSALALSSTFTASASP